MNGFVEPRKPRPVISHELPATWPRMETRGVRYPSTAPVSSTPFWKLASVGGDTPIDPLTASIPVFGTGLRDCADVCVATNIPTTTSAGVNTNGLMISLLSYGRV